MASRFQRSELLRDSEIFIEPKQKSAPKRVLSPRPLYDGRYFRPHTPQLLASLSEHPAAGQSMPRYVPPRKGLGAPPAVALEPSHRRRAHHHSHPRVRRPGSPTVEQAAEFRAARAQPICPCCAQVNDLSDKLAGRGPYERPGEESTHPPAAGGHAWFTGTDARIPDENPSQHPLDLYTQAYLPLGGLVDFEQAVSSPVQLLFHI